MAWLRQGWADHKRSSSRVKYIRVDHIQPQDATKNASYSDSTRSPFLWASWFSNLSQAMARFHCLGTTTASTPRPFPVVGVDVGIPNLSAVHLDFCRLIPTHRAHAVQRIMAAGYYTRRPPFCSWLQIMNLGALATPPHPPKKEEADPLRPVFYPIPQWGMLALPTQSQCIMVIAILRMGTMAVASKPPLSPWCVVVRSQEKDWQHLMNDPDARVDFSRLENELGRGSLPLTWPQLLG